MMRSQSSSPSIWGSGLLAVDIVMRSNESEPFEITAGGTCANVLANLAQFGWRSAAKGRVGNDSAGKVLAQHLTDIGVDTSSIVLDDKVETPIIVERFGLGEKGASYHRFEWKCPKCGSPVPRFRPTPISMLELTGVEATVPDVFFFDRPTPGNLRLATVLKEMGSIIMFEPPRLKADREFEVATRLATIVKTADTGDLSSIEQCLSSGSLAIVTQGSHGLIYMANEFRGIKSLWKQVQAFQLSKTLDACGSGDWLTAGLLHAFLAVNDLTEDVHARLEASLRYGQALASLNCLLPGARGLSRVYNRIEITEMVGLTLAKGFSALEAQVEKRSSEVGKLRDILSICNSCRRRSQ